LTGGAILAAILFRPGPLVSQGAPGGQAAGAVQTEIGAGPAISA